MASTDRVREDDAMAARSEAQEAQRVLEQKTNELLEFRDAGILTEAELEEQKAKLRWGIP
jgi:hypothetical protein